METVFHRVGKVNLLYKDGELHRKTSEKSPGSSLASPPMLLLLAMVEGRVFLGFKDCLCFSVQCVNQRA